MKAEDVIYTPLDLPCCPEIDLAKLTAWMNSVYPQKHLLQQTGNYLIAGINEKDAFPWEVVWAKALDWQSNFNEEFPELVNYIVNDWGIPENEIVAMTLLPKRASAISKDFWHSDLDKLGLRFYISFENREQDKLLFKKTLTSECKEENLFRTFQADAGLEHTVHTAHMLGDRQPYYLNNYLAAHNVKNTSLDRRIAVIVATSYEVNQQSKLKDRIDNLIVSSAQKYHKQAIFWHDWSDAIS
jgi:hypothetical protein